MRQKFEHKVEPGQEEAPMLKKRKQLPTQAEPSLASSRRDIIGADLPFSAEELEKYTCPEYVYSLTRSGIPLAAKWREAKVQQKRVLVVDDEPVVCNSVRKILSRRGYLVEESYDGRQALQRIEQSPYELVILDLVIPEIDGMEVLRRIKERWPEVNVIIITGYGSIESAKEATRLGAADYLPKPFTPQELVTAASEVLTGAAA